MFSFAEDYTLEDEMVSLRPLKLTDLKNLLPFSLNEPEIWKYSTIAVAGEENLKKYLDLAMNGRAAQKDYPFIVFDKRTNQYAGSTRFYDIRLDAKTLKLGYTWYGKQFQGTGLNKHCKYLLLSFAFEKMEMERVEFQADNTNERSIAAMKSIGCTVEGVLRSNELMPDGRRRDSIVLSILKKEWEDKVKSLLLNKLH